MNLESVEAIPLLTLFIFKANRNCSVATKASMSLVSCNSKNQPITVLSQDIYAIEEISYRYQSVRIINTTFIDATFDCISPIHNFTLDEKRSRFAGIR